MHVLTQEEKLCKNWQFYNARKFNAQSAHLANVRQYCAIQNLPHFQRRLCTIWVVGPEKKRRKKTYLKLSLCSSFHLFSLPTALTYLNHHC